MRFMPEGMTDFQDSTLSSSTGLASILGRLVSNEQECRARTETIRMNTMNHVFHLLVAVAILSEARAEDVKRNIPYADPAHERQVLDVYSPHNAKNLPVVFWIHGGGWQTGDKSNVQIKPQFFMDKG